MSFLDLKKEPIQKTYYGRRDSESKDERLNLSQPGQSVSESIAHYQQFTSIIRNYSQKIGTWEDTVDMRERMHRTIDGAKALAVNIVSQIAQSSQATRPLSDKEASLLKIQQQKLARDFEKQVRVFQDVVTRALKMETGCQPHTPTSIEKQRLEMKRKTMQEEEERLLAQSQIQYQESVYLSDVIRDRKEGMWQIQSNIQEVNRIFKQLAVIVRHQQESIDVIEADTVDTKSTAARGLEEIQRGRDRGGVFNRCALWCFLVVLMIIGLFLFLIMLKR